MKKILNPKNLPLTVFAAGILALLLRFLVNLLAIDSRGLIVTSHPLVIILWIVTALTAALTLLQVWGMDGSRRYTPNFPASRSAAISCGIMALCTMVTTALSWEITTLGLLRYVLGLAAGACLIFLTYCRYRGIKPSFLFHAVVCVFFAIHMVSRYRPLSAEPQMLNFLFEIFACVGLTLFAYQQAAFEVGLGKRRMQLALGLLTAYCCLVAIPAAPRPLLYAGGAVWALTNLCTLTPPPRRRKAAPEAPRDDTHETA